MEHTIEVTGMTCEGCESNVEEALDALGGVTVSSADSETDTVSLEGSPDWDAVEQAVAEAGYEVAR